LVANCFGDRWTYIEITAFLWVLTAASIRAMELTESESGAQSKDALAAATNPYLAYR